MKKDLCLEAKSKKMFSSAFYITIYYNEGKEKKLKFVMQVMPKSPQRKTPEESSISEVPRESSV